MSVARSGVTQPEAALVALVHPTDHRWRRFIAGWTRGRERSTRRPLRQANYTRAVFEGAFHPRQTEASAAVDSNEFICRRDAHAPPHLVIRRREAVGICGSGPD